MHRRFLQPTKAPGKNECNHNQLVYYSGHYESYGLNCQAVCDHKLRFIYFGVVGPGSMNDAVAFRHTQIKEKILDNLEEGDYMLGDATYPISEKLLVPLTGSQRNDIYQDSFNFHLSQLRIRIEMAFGRLVRKWRILKSLLELSIKNNVKVLKACAALHNFCIDQEEDDEEEGLNHEDEISVTAINRPSGFLYLPSRVEDRDDFEEFVQSTETNRAIVRRVIVDFMRLNNIQ